MPAPDSLCGQSFRLIWDVGKTTTKKEDRHLQRNFPTLTKFTIWNGLTMEERRAAIDELSCFSCKQTLANAAPTFNDDIWTVACPACGVVNKLTPALDRADHFKVSGAFFVIQKAPRE